MERGRKWFISMGPISGAVIGIFLLNRISWPRPKIEAKGGVAQVADTEPIPKQVSHGDTEVFRLRRRTWPSSRPIPPCPLTSDEMLSEDKLIWIIQEWDKTSADEGQKRRVAYAISSLGDMKSVKAIDTLVNNISFQFSEPAPGWSHYVGSDDAPPMSSYSQSLAALRKLGSDVAHPVIARLAELDEGTHFRDVFLLRQVLLGVFPRHKAALLLREEAVRIQDATERKRLEKTASILESSYAIAK